MLKYGLALLAIFFAVLIYAVFSSFVDEEAQVFEPSSEVAIADARGEELEPRRYVPVEKGTAVSAEQESTSSASDLEQVLLQGLVVNELGQPIPEVALSFVGVSAPGQVVQNFPVPRLVTDRDGRFEFRAASGAPFIRVIAAYQDEEPTTETFSAGSIGVEIWIERKAHVVFRLESAPSTTLEGVTICFGKQQVVVPERPSNRVLTEFTQRFHVEPGLYNLKIVSAFGEKTLFEIPNVDLRVGETRDLGLIQLATEAVKVTIHLHFPKELIGALGFLEAVTATEDDEGSHTKHLVLAKPGEVVTMLLPGLPIDLRAAFDGCRLLVYSLNQVDVAIALEVGFEREFILETAMSFPKNVKVIVSLMNLEAHRRSDEVVVEQGRAPSSFHLTDFGQHEMSLRLQVPKADAFDRTVKIPLPPELSTVVVTREDESAIRLRLDANLELKIREAIEAIR